jgi:hypothetical protein
MRRLTPKEEPVFDKLLAWREEAKAAGIEHGTIGSMLLKMVVGELVMEYGYDEAIEQLSAGVNAYSKNLKEWAAERGEKI